MDYLPSPLLVNIFSYLTGKDVFRFIRLCSSFREIIDQNQIYLKKPLIAVEIYNRHNDPNNEVCLNIFSRREKIDKNHCRFYHKSDDRLSDNYINFKDFNENFFDEFHSWEIPKDDESYYLRLQLDYMLAKADIDELSVMHLHNLEWFTCLTEAIKASSCRISTVLTSPYNLDAPGVNDLLEAVGNQKDKEKAKPLLRLGNELHNFLEWFDLRRINDVAGMFHSARMETWGTNVEYLMESVVEEWKEDPFPEFNFHIQVITNMKDKEKLNYILYSKGVSSTNEDYFYKISPEDEPSTVRITDESGIAIEFEKKNGATMKQYTKNNAIVTWGNTFIVSMKTFM